MKIFFADKLIRQPMKIVEERLNFKKILKALPPHWINSAETGDLAGRPTWQSIKIAPLKQRNNENRVCRRMQGSKLRVRSRLRLKTPTTIP